MFSRIFFFSFWSTQPWIRIGYGSGSVSESGSVSGSGFILCLCRHVPFRVRIINTASMGFSHALMSLCVQVSKNTQDPEWNYEAQVTLPDQGDKTITIEVCFYFMEDVYCELGTDPRVRTKAQMRLCDTKHSILQLMKRSVILML
jgi:hypothetical protein